MILPAPHIEHMGAYALASMPAPPDGQSLLSLSQNESLRPPSPVALDAAARALRDGALYPDPDWTALRSDLAAQYDVPMEGILCGHGSLDLIGCIARVFSGPARAVLVPVHAYPFFRSAGQMAGARVDAACERNVTVCVDSLLEAVRPDTGLVFLANPGNPTGTRIPRSELVRLRAGLRADVLLVIDEAYGEFTVQLGEGSFEMVKEGATVVLKTFSKAYGLAGFRVGWGVFPQAVAAQLRKVMNPNNVSGPAQAAARGALTDQTYMRATCDQTGRIREAARFELLRMGLPVPESHTNFLLIDLFDVTRAQRVDAALRSEGVVFRWQGGAGLPHMLRMTVGTDARMARALQTLERVLQEESI